MTILRCAACTQEKLLTEFSKDKTRKNGRNVRCKECVRASSRFLYEKTYRDKYDVQYKAIRHRNAQWLRQLKSNLKCECGESSSSCLDLHHKDASAKKFNLANANSGRALKQIQSEALKCIAICSNCHRKHHAGEISVDHIPLITPSDFPT